MADPIRMRDSDSSLKTILSDTRTYEKLKKRSNASLKKKKKKKPCWHAQEAYNAS